jgi:predicted DCC family thiol-disulfide oxidoreductase YuxK
MTAPAERVIYYDGVCALCNGWVTFVIARDPAGAFRFASLQSEYASRTLNRAPDIPPETIILRDGDVVYERSVAVLRVLRDLKSPWRAAYTMFHWIPRPISDAAYTLVARLRYRTFGKYDMCPIPAPEIRDRFIDV